MRPTYTVIPLSVLDLATVATGSTPARAFAETTATAIEVERLGYRRLWVAEHHGMPAVASSAPAVLIAHLANATTTLRVGSGGVMLPNHAPLVMAEQFATLEALHPGRIDLGLGRAPGTDHVTARALRRNLDLGAESFPNDVVELIKYLLPADGEVTHPFANPGQRLPARGVAARIIDLQRAAGGDPRSLLLLRVPLRPAGVGRGACAYRENFQPSIVLAEPHVMIAVSVICAATTEEARWLSGSSALSIVQMRTGRRGELPSPEEAAAYEFTPLEEEIAAEAMSTHLIGDQSTVRDGLVALLERTAADEIMVSTRLHSLAARLRSFDLVAQAWGIKP